MKGFLPEKQPSKAYSISNNSLDLLTNVANDLPKLLLTGQLQKQINHLKKNDFEINELLINKKPADINLAMRHLSFIAHGYIWGDVEPHKILPAVIAKPWVQIANELGRPPILSYASYCLDNWYKIDSEQEISLENVALINNFLGGVDEDWFVTIHVVIEDRASNAVCAAGKIKDLDEEATEGEIKQELINISKSMREVNKIFARMPEKCDPYVYYHRVRPFIFGSKDNPDLKSGLVYDGEFKNKAQFFRGETGAQSSIIPTLDAALMLKHSNDSLRHYLNEMREYMPPKHNQYIKDIESKSILLNLINDSKALQSSYDECLEEIRIFRSMHLEYAGTYIHQQSQLKNPFGRGGSTITGTGGTPFMKYLKKHRDESQDGKYSQD
jgi:indoleamine 2,3-dioxygenase